MESDGEIEYLDEDADIVQQCVQLPITADSESTKSDGQIWDETPLLVERPKSERKRKRKTEEDDSDYDPNEDILPPSPPSPPVVKKKRPTSRKSVTKPLVTLLRTYQSIDKSLIKPSLVMDRKKMDIRIPDYEDPLCLPVRALRSFKTDINRLKNWNNACIEHLKHSDNLFKPEKGLTKSSTRTIVLKNMIHKDSGRSETVVWTKTAVINEEGVRKSELFQSVLPKFREKNLVSPFNVLNAKRKKFHHKDEVVLCKEDHKDGNTLVVYKSQDAFSAVYKFDTYAERDGREPGAGEGERVLREVASCRMCAPCYQTSWRGTNAGDDKKRLVCPVCGRVTISVYNLLRHLRAHPEPLVRAHRPALARALAMVVDYHYKCRICLEKLPSIKGLREHVLTHKGTKPFKCEVGDHMTT